MSKLTENLEAHLVAAQKVTSGLEEFARSQWRLIVEVVPRSGPANMAIDQAIAEAVARGVSLPTLRFYRWAPPAISIGRHQPASEIDFAAAQALGYEVVRRATGGRAILHIDELTYSVAAPRDEPRIQGGVMDSYLRLSNGLLAGLKQLGVEADKAGAGVRAGKEVSAACFEVPSAYEITVGGRKLMGSAQSRRRDYMLQHGTLPLTGDITRLIQVLVLSDAERQLLTAQLTQRACTLTSALGGCDQDADALFALAANALRNGMAQTLNLDFPEKLIRTAPTEAELVRAAQLIREQYGNPEWTLSR